MRLCVQQGLASSRVLENGGAGALTVDECWRLVETSERTHRHCMMLENCCGNYYPTHGLGPVAKYMDINRGDRAWSRLVELTERSVDGGSVRVDVPDFTRGAWRTAKPSGLMETDLARLPGLGGVESVRTFDPQTT